MKQPEGTTYPAAWFLWDQRPNKPPPVTRGYLLTSFRRRGRTWRPVWKWYR